MNAIRHGWDASLHGELVDDQLLGLDEQQQGGSTGLLYARIEVGIPK
jgi:hypothetical protein